MALGDSGWLELAERMEAGFNNQAGARQCGDDQGPCMPSGGDRFARGVQEPEVRVDEPPVWDCL
ncbi:MAG: hypothetical protein EOM12_09905 [Verrucomicrobiae bacterium]|nr:hypothetical protein [Verrucomicrobiae bacterium]